jgi:hypothetical protein
MERQPTLHITANLLAQLLEEVSISNNGTSYKETALTMIEMAHRRGFQIRGRNLTTLATRTAKNKAERLQSIDVDIATALNFQSVLNMRRQQEKHTLITTIDVAHKDFALLKEIAGIAEEFCDVFDIKNKLDGYNEFITIGFQLTNKRQSFRLNNFKLSAQKIFDIYKAVTMLIDDKNKDGSKKLRLEYERSIVELCGSCPPIEKSYELVNFVYAREEADDAKAKYKDWVKAQFEGLSFLGVIPEIYQLHGDGALSRYNAFMKQKNAKDKEEDTVTAGSNKSYWDLIDKLDNK